MTDAEAVLVQATTTYLEGSEHKSEHSAPYLVKRSHGLELEAQGFARIVGPAQPAAAPADPEPAAPAVEVDPAPLAPRAEPTALRRRGRPPGKRV